MVLVNMVMAFLVSSMGSFSALTTEDEGGCFVDNKVASAAKILPATVK